MGPHFVGTIYSTAAVNGLASVGVTPRSKQLGVTPRTPLFEGKNPENQKLKISIK